MVHDGTIGLENASNEEEKVKPPNRNNYERELGRLNDEIEFLRKQAKIKLNKEGNAGSISEAKLAREAIRKQREELAQGASKVKEEIVDLRKQLDVMKTARLDVEKECRVRSRDKLESYLKNCESRYNAQNLSVKEERVLVEEIDALKRNRTKLEKLSEIVKGIGAIEEKMAKLKKSNEETYREIFRLKAEQQTQSAEQRRRLDEFFRIQRGLDTLHDEKRSLIGNYNQQREKYADWAKHHKKKHTAYPTTFPTCRQRTISQSLVEEEELEPFYEQKRDCRRLIKYLEKLKGQMELLESVTNAPEKAADTDSDSADEFPSSFARLGVHQNKKPEEPAKPEPAKPRKIGNLKKATQPISHGLEIYGLFTSVEVAVPANYQDVPRALEEVRERLSFFDQQTNVIDWYAELGDCQLTLPSMSRSVSEYTGDSACIDSETASLASSRLHPVSPVADPRFSRNPSSNADEGISSKESHPDSTTCYNQ